MRVAVLLLSLAASLAAQQPDGATLDAILARAGERVQEFFARAQSLVCLETVRLMPLSASWGAVGNTRTVESELRLSWEDDASGVPAAEASVLRQLLRVNGRPPRGNDLDNCTEPEQESQQTQPLSLLLPGNRHEYRFTLAGRGRADDRAAILVDYRHVARASATSSAVDGRDDCVSWDFEGGLRGRLWIDDETHEVLRLDQHLVGLVDIPLPREVTRWPGRAMSFTLERWDTTIRFRRVTFTEPDETLTLPVSMTSMRIVRGSGNPRLRTTTEYSNYRRFLTAGRIVQP